MINNLTDLIAKKLQSKDDKLQVKVYESETLGGSIEVRKLTLKKYMELVGNVEGDSIDGMNALLFECCPIFKTNTKEAMEAYGVEEATDLPSAVLNDQLNEIKDLVELTGAFYGLDRMDEVEADVKN